MWPVGVAGMPRGGARVNSGPPPDPKALRRDRPSDKDGWTTLPAEGYDGPVPEWPLASPADVDDTDVGAVLSMRELQRWELVWRTPQAAAWARLGWADDVAVYVRLMSLVELGDVKQAGEARQWSDRLGLNPAAMLRNRWRVSADQVAVHRESRGVAPSELGPRRSSRDRLRAVPGGGA